MSNNFLRSFWRGHLFLFDPKLPPKYSAQTGVRLLLIFVLMEGILGPRLSLFGVLGLPVPDTFIRVTGLLLLSLVLIRFVAKLHPSELGLRAWKNWTATEKSYFIQILIIANIIFSATSSRQLSIVLSHQSIWVSTLPMFVGSMIWGFYQEVIYRGIVQTELIRRWNTAGGILVSNLLYTFGPLHFYHFQIAKGNPGHLWIFTAIFAIGLFFSVLYRRSGNLWIVGICHGIGDCYLVGLLQAAALAKGL
jgi:uncharacterized protein